MGKIDDALLKLRALSYEEEAYAAAKEADALRAAIRPFAGFARKWDAKPIRGIDDVLYGIHGGLDSPSGFGAEEEIVAEAISRPNDAKHDLRTWVAEARRARAEEARLLEESRRLLADNAE